MEGFARETAMPDQPPADATPPSDIGHISIIDEMKASYLNYAMSVIVARALPDVRDGLKPVHRRILWGAQESGFTANKPFRKSARIVGDVMGKYHPHGDQSIYDALARMAQDWSMRVPLIDGQGNFGSMDPDKPAAMRYTEARLNKAAEALLGDIDRDTVDFVPNYDGQESEPSVLPARFPNLLVNGAGGIAVGMATNIAPHNLGEVVAACIALVDNPALSVDELMAFIPAPDFPTGGLILGSTGARAAYHTGRGSIMLRSRHIVEEGRGERRSIVLTEVPYQQGKNVLVERIAEAVKDKRVEGVSDVRDESNREGVRVVIDLKRDATPDVTLNQLWRHTPAQGSFAINMLALRGGRPELLGLKDVLVAFIAFREEVITRRSKFDLAKARDRAHILLGLVIAVTNLDEVVRIIRASATPAAARTTLLEREWDVAEIRPYLALVEAAGDDAVGDIYRLSDVQVRAILELRLAKLTALGREEIGDELRELAASIEELLAILGDRAKLYAVMRAEFEDIARQFPSPRRSEIVENADGIEDEDLIARADMVITVTMTGYIKRVPLETYRAQKRGGKGRSAMNTKADDVVSELFVASTHAPVLFFSTLGRVYRLKTYRLPEGAPGARGRAMANLLPLAEGETISTVLPLPEDEAEWGRLHVMFATERGLVRRNSMDAFTNVPLAGKIAMRFEEGADDRLIGVALCNAADDVLLATRAGKAIRFAAEQVREFQSRTATGVRGITLAPDDAVISLTILGGVSATPEEREAYLANADALAPERRSALASAEQFLLTVTAGGFGKRTSAYAYRRSGRGGQGIATLNVTPKTGPVLATFPVADGEHLMLVTNQGKLIRTEVGAIRIAGRATQGVKLLDVADGEQVVSAARIPEDDE